MRNSLEDWQILNMAYAMICFGPMMQTHQTIMSGLCCGVKMMIYHVMFCLMPLISACMTAISVKVAERSRKAAELIAITPTVAALVIFALFVSLL